ncbi:MAG TPA: sulfatase/phosphatase domain-containing protein, partial [Thermomicrobiales bacterium]|nr:sulfatase/phosphatase domain-containing protein [Thermomicrobiales bacterium]
TPPWRDAVIGQYHGKQRWFCPIRMVRTATHKFTRYTTGERELYDLAADPAERHNRAGDPGYAAIERDLAGRLAAWMETEGDPFPHFRATDREGR